MQKDIMEFEVIDMLTTLVEKKDTYTGGHSKRVATYASKIAEALGLEKNEVHDIYYCGLLHDVGKILTPDTILVKPERFSPKEYDIIKKHASDSEKIVKRFSSFMKYRKTIRHHHERYDGKGYPDRLAGEKIPLPSRILSIADAFDAMTTNRIYKKKKSVTEALEELTRNSGKQFDPDLLETAIGILKVYSKETNSQQKPVDFFDEQRYAHFFKDKLTSAYSAHYLNHFLQENIESKNFKCCYFIQVHNMHGYNKKYGWLAGNEVLVEITLRIKALFGPTFVFRIFGDDFVVLNKAHTEVESDIPKKLTSGFDLITTTFRHFNLHEENISSWQELEEFVIIE